MITLFGEEYPILYFVFLALGLGEIIYGIITLCRKDMTEQQKKFAKHMLFLGIVIFIGLIIIKNIIYGLGK